MNDKTFEPEIIVESPFPNEPEVFVPISNTNPQGTYEPTVTKSKPFRKKVVAQETISAAINTKSRKVLQTFELQQSGGFQIGQFVQGLSADIRITPEGMVARSADGIETFVLVGSDGSAIFRGEIRAGSLVSGRLTIGNNAFVVEVNEDGQATLLINDGDNDRVLIGFQSGGF